MHNMGVLCIVHAEYESSWYLWYLQSVTSNILHGKSMVNMNETIYLLDEYPTKHVGRLLHTLFRASDTNTVTRFIYKRPCNLDFAGKRFGFNNKFSSPWEIQFPLGNCSKVANHWPLSILFSHYSMTIYFNIVLTVIISTLENIYRTTFVFGS